jgi:protein-S-isoprenylcysteine O-methyltransferase Ste14
MLRTLALLTAALGAYMAFLVAALSGVPHPFLYRIVRHPLISGFLLVFWATPVMTVDRLVFALGMSLYILIGLAFEERALRREFGSVYETYEAAVPRLIPLQMKRRKGLL